MDQKLAEHNPEAAGKQSVRATGKSRAQFNVYEDLRSPGSIRLFELLPPAENGGIRGRLCQVDLLQTRGLASKYEYAAVSYTWGPHDPRTEREIEIDGGPFTVRQNLRDLLQIFSTSELRKARGGRLLLWIDAICIDQSNLAERNHQVHLMNKIFASAQEVIVWLGLPDPDFHLLRKEWSQIEGRFKVGHNKHTNGLILSICGREFWRRLWIVQEICVAREISILTQKSTLSWGAFMDMASTRAPESAYIRRQLHDGPANSVIALRNWRRNAFGQPRKSSMAELLKAFADQECHDPRDRVFGLLGLAEGGDAYTIDYFDSPTAVLHKTLQHFAPGHDILPMAEMLCSALKLDGETYLEQMVKLRNEQLCSKYCARSVTVHGSTDTTSLKLLTMRRFSLDGNSGSIKEVLLCECSTCATAMQDISEDQVDRLLDDDDLFLHRVRFLKSTYILFRRDIADGARLIPVGCAEIDPLPASGARTDFRVLIYAVPDEMNIEMLPHHPFGNHDHHQADYSISFSSFMLCKVFFLVSHARYSTLIAAWEAQQTDSDNMESRFVRTGSQGSMPTSQTQSAPRPRTTSSRLDDVEEAAEDEVPELVEDEDPVDWYLVDREDTIA